MQEAPNNLEALKLISDWAKWIVAIQTAVIALIGSLFTSEYSPDSVWSRFFGTSTIICFLLSIAAAAMLLLTLPEIAQYLQPNQNIWLTYDSIVYSIGKRLNVNLNTQAFAILESIFFGLGFTFATAMLITIIWS